MPRPKRSERWSPKADDKPALERIHDRYSYATDRWDTIRQEAKTDMKHVKGDPWPDQERRARIKAKRPVIALDELGQYENQVVNEVRANPRAIKFSPVGDGANDATARFYDGKTREIEYRSHGAQHYIRAFQNMVERSYGYVKVRTEFIHHKPAMPTDTWSAFEQRLCIDGVADPDSILPDPDFVDPTGRDWKYLFEEETRTISEFKRDFPKAEITSFTPELVKYSQGWVTDQTVRIASYWEVEKSRKGILAFEVMNPQSGQPLVYEVWEDEKDVIELLKAQGGIVKAERVSETPQVTQFLTNGVEILKETPWSGKWIPYVAMFGKMLWMDEGSGPELVLMSMTRLARDPNMLHAYYTSCEAELIGGTPRSPWWAWKGSLDPKNLTLVQKAAHEPVAVIEVDPMLAGGMTPTPSLPKRLQFEPPIQAIEIGKEGARRAIQAAMGLTPLPTSAQRRNEKSGIALRQIEESGQRGSYHFIDSYNMGIERVGELLEDMIPKVYDTATATAVLAPDQKPAMAYINGAQAPEDADKDVDVLASIEGLHAVTIDVGPAYASEREQASDFVDTFVTSQMFTALPPPMALEILSLLVKLKNLGPVGDQIAKVLNPPKDENQQQLPPQVIETLKQGEQLVQALQQRVQELEQEQAAKVTETEGKLAADAQDHAAKERLEAMKIDASLREVELQADTDVRLQEMEDRIAELGLLLKAQIEGAKLEQQTAVGAVDREMAEIGRREAREDAAEERAMQSDKGEA